MARKPACLLFRATGREGRDRALWEAFRTGPGPALGRPVPAHSETPRPGLAAHRAVEATEPRRRPTLRRPGRHRRHRRYRGRADLDPAFGPGHDGHPSGRLLSPQQRNRLGRGLWRTYITLTDLEAVFRSLKSELGLGKPIRAEGHPSPSSPTNSSRSSAAAWPHAGNTPVGPPCAGSSAASTASPPPSVAPTADPACAQGHPRRTASARHL